MVQTQETLKKNDAARDERLKGLEDVVETASENIDILSAQNPDKIRCIQYSTKKAFEQSRTTTEHRFDELQELQEVTMDELQNMDIHPNK